MAADCICLATCRVLIVPFSVVRIGQVGLHDAETQGVLTRGIVCMTPIALVG